MKFFLRVGYNERAPFWYGLVRTEVHTASVLLAPIPLNVPIRAAWLLYRWLSSPFAQSVHENPPPRRRAWECCVCGRDVNREDWHWCDVRRFQLVCGRCVDTIVRHNVTVVMADKTGGEEP